MKTIKSIALFVCGALFIWSCDDEYVIKKKDKELAPDYGCITGKITFYNTESVIGAYVQLISKEKGEVVYSGLINQGGGYTIENIVPDTYKFRVYKSGYIDTVFSSTVLIRPQSQQGNSCTNLDWAITKLPPLLRIVDDKGKVIDTLYFGSDKEDNARLFSIFNDSPKNLYWSITKPAQWISSINPGNGSLRPGESKPVIVNIDRKKISAGVNKTVLQIISEEGSKQLTVIAMGYYKSPEVKVFPVTKLEGASAVFQGKVIHKGEPAYKEKGFVYGSSSMPTLENTIVKLAVSEASDSLFEATAMELQAKQKYYVRSYAIGQLDTVYSIGEETFYAQKACTEIYTEEPTDKDYTQGTVTVKARITQEGYPRYTKRGFVYDEVKNPILGDAVDIPVEGYGTGFYSARLRGLEIGKKYYVKAYAVQEDEVVYGSEVEVDFTPVLPEMET
ncbi:MAG: carboxypeptidase-like regulatory domain-containing protein, partial [Bacteroidales bacterium]|nr:carboxypeptidase-like regulatory domain-containing protein [Bacteroidales bacterium]